MNTKHKYAILGEGRFYNINYYRPNLARKDTSSNLFTVQDVCDTLNLQFSHVKFKVVKVKKVKATD